jgi:hypothetical protein
MARLSAQLGNYYLLGDRQPDWISRIIVIMCAISCLPNLGTNRECLVRLMNGLNRRRIVVEFSWWLEIGEFSLQQKGFFLEIAV